MGSAAVNSPPVLSSVPPSVPHPAPAAASAKEIP